MSSVIAGTRAGREFAFPERARRQHTHVVGLSTFGKSYFVEGLIRQDIQNGAGVCVIDPHGEMYERLLQWLMINDMHLFREVHLINPSDPRWSFSFNPLVGSGHRDTNVAALMEAIKTVFENRSLTQTPLLNRILSTVLNTLAETGLSLTEARILTSQDIKGKQARDALVCQLPKRLKAEWQSIVQTRSLGEDVKSSDNRVFEFTNREVIRSFVGHVEQTFDFREAMDNRAIVLVNLKSGNGFTEFDAQMLGSILQTAMFTRAKDRDPEYGRDNPFYAYIDECSDYLTLSTIKGLDEARKFGLHYTLIHQRTQQLKSHGDDFYHGLLEAAQNKFVFRCGQSTASDLVETLFGRVINFEEPKQSMVRPIQVGVELEWLYSESEGTVETDSESTTEGFGNIASTTESYGPNGIEAGPQAHSIGEADSSSSSATSSYSQSRINTVGKSQTYKPIYKDLPTQNFSLEEQWLKARNELTVLPERTAFSLLVHEGRPVRFTTLDLPPIDILKIPEKNDRVKSAVLLEKYADLINEHNPLAVRRAETNLRIEQRYDRVLAGDWGLSVIDGESPYSPIDDVEVGIERNVDVEDAPFNRPEPPGPKDDDYD